MTTAALPPLTGSRLFDPWRLRYRQRLASGAETVPVRRPTRSERLLWEAVQDSAHRWVAEHPTVHGYTLDFFCAEARLAIEVDGPSHWGRHKAERDEWRDLTHERLGIRTKRFSAREVENDVGWVAGEIEALAAARLDASPEPPAVREEPSRQVVPSESPGWSAALPACRTVLPSLPVQRSLLRRAADSLRH